jgi:hypothetical protein
MHDLVILGGTLIDGSGAPRAARHGRRRHRRRMHHLGRRQGRPHRISWARLLKLEFDIDMQHGLNCGAGKLKIIAAILERTVIEKILDHLGLDAHPPPKGRAREPGPHFAA